MTFPCQQCRKISPSNLRCTKCQAVYYCGKDCQAIHWKTHKEDCVRPCNNAPILPQYHMEYKKAYPKDKEDSDYLEKIYFSTHLLSELGQEDNTPLLDRLFDARWFGTYRLEDPPGSGFLSYKKNLLQMHKAGSIEPGTVFPLKTEYGGSLNYRNHQPIRLNYHIGEVYVGIGFTDIFQLLIGDFRDSKAEEDMPMTFFGIDCSERAIAKTRIIYNMLQDEVTSARSILQVWFSSVLDREAYDALKRALNNIICDATSVESEILEFLAKLSMKSPPTTRSAFDSCRKQTDFMHGFPLNYLANHQDRMQYARYLFTGTIFCEEKDAFCGNPTIVVGSLETGGRDNFFSIVDHQCLKEYETNLLQTVESHYIRKTNELKDLIMDRKIVCKFRQWTVTTTSLDEELAKEIKEMQPALIDWSNVPDYLDITSFLNFAKTCSAENTIHSLNSMNWTKMTYGAGLVDYAYLDGYDPKKMSETAKNFIALVRKAEMKKKPFLKRILNYEDDKGSTTQMNAAVLGWHFREMYLSKLYGGESSKDLKVIYMDPKCHFVEVYDMEIGIDFVLGNCKLEEATVKKLLKKFISAYDDE